MVKQIMAAVTDRGQVTIPAEVRRTLGIEPPGKVAFALDDEGGVKLVAASYTLESAFGSVSPLSSTGNFKNISREAKNKAADRVLGKMRGL